MKMLDFEDKDIAMLCVTVIAVVAFWKLPVDYAVEIVKMILLIIGTLATGRKLLK